MKQVQNQFLNCKGVVKRWHHRLNEHEFEQRPGNGGGHGSLACCSPWGHKEPDRTEPLNNKKQTERIKRMCLGNNFNSFLFLFFPSSLLFSGLETYRAGLIAQLVKNPPAIQEILVSSLGWEDPLEKGNATHSSILAWRIPWTVLAMGLQRVRRDFHFQETTILIHQHISIAVE